MLHSWKIQVCGDDPALLAGSLYGAELPYDTLRPG